MGQYYKTVLMSERKDDTQKIITVDNNCGFSEYHGLKLMEHSYLNNEWTDLIAVFIYKNKCRMSHVGDYAYEYPQYVLAYNENVAKVALKVDDMCYDAGGKILNFNYRGKFLVNWTKETYVSFDEYMKKGFSDWSKEVYICPFTLLTALGNGRGGGDYYNDYPNCKRVGDWAWDVISIEDDAPDGFKQDDVYFTEWFNKEREIKDLEIRIQRQKEYMQEQKIADDFYYMNGRHSQDVQYLHQLESLLKKYKGED